MPHTHGPNEEHVTETFGTQVIEPRIVVIVLRMKAARGVASEEEQARVTGVIDKWVGRYCRRRDITWTNLSVSAIGANVGEPPDALAVSFFGIQVPPDWLCFSSLIARAILPPELPFGLVPLTQLFDLDIDREDEPTDVVEVEMVGGRKVTLGTTKRTTN